ncbi:unnamed protein product [Auanema sp. JU1783]|nr:unnamed protein product [Auanema sp. JU1783]
MLSKRSKTDRAQSAALHSKMKSSSAHDEKQKHALIMDIEGTISSIDFVKNVLFPYSMLHVQDFLKKFSVSDDEKCAELMKQLLHASDADAKTDPDRFIKPRMETMAHDIALNCIEWVKQDKKLTCLKEIQGKMWKEGYATGAFRSELYEDVFPALSLLKDTYDLYVYSSGSETAQKLFMEYTQHGDLSYLISGFFDTKIGSKTDKSSYEKICSVIDKPPHKVIFITDSFLEATAARKAEIEAKLVIRPGNAPLPPEAAEFEIIKSVWEIKPAQMSERHVFIDSDDSN